MSVVQGFYVQSNKKMIGSLETDMPTECLCKNIFKAVFLITCLYMLKKKYVNSDRCL